jgi:group I intron endonuclease
MFVRINTGANMKALLIYVIRNVVDQKFYVGSTANMRERFRTHRNKLRKGTHHCHHLQAAWNKYGGDVFKFEVVERLPDDATYEQLQAAEDTWLIKHVGTKECYNHGIRSGAPWRGCRPEDHPNYGKVMPEAAKAALSEATKRQWGIADPRTGRSHTAETKALISASLIGKHAGENHYRYGTTLSDEVRAKISNTQRGVPKPPRTKEHRRRLSEANKGNQNWLGKQHSEESRLKMSKRVLEVSTNIEFPSLTAVLQHYGMTMPTLRRALVSGSSITKGKFTGLLFRYVDHSLIP